MTSVFPSTYNLCVLISIILVNSFKSHGNGDNAQSTVDINENGNNCTTLMKDGLIYDLSSLYQEDYWQYLEASHTLDEKENIQYRAFYLSICHPIIGVSKCGSATGVCFNDPNNNSTDFISAGTNSKPSILYEGMIEVTFENGQLCQSILGGDTFYSTKLYLQCPSFSESESDLESETGPILLTSKNPCSFMFIWTTFSACPKKVVSKEGCIIKLSNSEYPINLHALSTTNYYNVSGFKSTFEMNICETVTNGSCPGNNVLVCDTTKQENPKVIASTDDLMFGTNITNGLLYYSEKVEMRLLCDRTEFSPLIRYYPQNNGLYLKHIFSIHSVFLCSPKEIDCVFEGYNMQLYDLRPLHKKENNWEVIVREDNQQKLFHLNVCGPINTNSIAQCPQGPIGVCQTSVTASSARNHGFITSHPVVNADDSITLFYSGGDSCREGVPTSSSRINLICSSFDYNPIFVEVTDSCEYVFMWHTRSACPQNVVSGKDCLVTDPLYGHVYDLNPLRNKMTDYKVTNGDVHFLVNICGPLIAKCEDGDQGKNAGICQLGDNKMSGGSYPAQLVFNDGTIFMKFSNGSLGYNSSQCESQILLLCSHNDIGDQGPQYLHADNSCTHYFIWYTKYACPPHTEINCIARNGDDIYDLTPLSNPKFNQIFIISDNTKKFILNVCRSVVHSKESRCSYDAGSCLIDMTHKNETLSLGKVTDPPIFEKGSLKLRYTNGGSCNTNHKYETLIEFKCSNEEYLSYPNFIGKESCLYLFEWATIHACPQSISANIPSTTDKPGDCTVLNPRTNYSYNMNSLSKNKPYEIHLSDNSLLLVSACGEIRDTRCKSPGVGACVVGKNPWQKYSSNAGLANKRLQFYMWNTFLEYSGGDKCKNGFERSTKISFVCKGDIRRYHLSSGPILIDDDEEACAFFINWYTERACERHINCIAKWWNRVIDLTPLVRDFGNFEIKDPHDASVKYLINVCRPLNPVNGTNCHPGSSACMINSSSPAQASNPLSLGHTIITPSAIGEEKALLMYAYGSPCPDHPDQLLSSKIFFKCNKDAGPGLPTFMRRTQDCQVQFEWQTSFVCKDLSKDVGDQCQIYFDAAKANLELRPLYRPDGYKVDYNNKTFLLNVCGSVCSHSGVCTESGENFGLSQKSELKWNLGLLVLQYYSGEPCEWALTGFKTSKIFFNCDMSAGYGEPIPDPLMADSHCMAIFNWPTNATCLEAIYNPNVPSHSSPKVPPHNEDQTTSSSTSLTSSTAMPDASPVPSHNRGSVAIGIIVLAVVIVAVMFFLARGGLIQRAFNRIRFFSKKGEQLLILDDHI